MSRRFTTAVLAVLVLAGCSQADALAPVGGNTLSEVRFAALDVLLDAGVELLIAPVCTQDGDGPVSCTGSTLEEQPIKVRSTAGDTPTMTVSVGGQDLWSGPIWEVLDAAAEGRRTEPTS